MGVTERLLEERALKLEEALNKYVASCTNSKSEKELGKVVAFRINNKSGEFEFLCDAEEMVDLPDGVSSNSSSIILSSFQREAKPRKIIFGYVTKEGYGCDKKTFFAAVCRDDIFVRPCLEGEKNFGQLYLLTI